MDIHCVEWEKEKGQLMAVEMVLFWMGFEGAEGARRRQMLAERRKTWLLKKKKIEIKTVKKEGIMNVHSVEREK